MSLGKWFVLGIWVLAVVGSLAGENSTVATMAGFVLLFLVVAHILECVIFQSRMRAAGGSLGNHVVQTMLFGIFHIQELPK